MGSASVMATILLVGWSSKSSGPPEKAPGKKGQKRITEKGHFLAYLAPQMLPLVAVQRGCMAM
jgi:hypothetical protein